MIKTMAIALATTLAAFDITNGRLLELDIELQIEFEGRTTVSDGTEGTLHGVVSYRSSQALVQ